MKKWTTQLTALMALALAAILLAPASALAADTVEMHRLYNPNSGEHFYTASAGEKSALVDAGWRSEGVGWVAPVSSSTPIYRLYNKNGGDHHYTTSAGESAMLVAAGWRNEGVGWYSDDDMTYPVYRQYNPHASSGAHNFTTSKGENDNLVAAGWRGEGIAWYACAKGYSTPSVNPTPSQPTVGSNGGLTDAEVTNRLLALKASYPDGTPWTNANSYTSSRSYAQSASSASNAVPYVMTGSGCAGFALLAQDAVYGSGRTYVKDPSFDWDAIRPGDHLRINNGGHSVVVLTKSADSITVVEGNLNQGIYWGRAFTRDEVASTFAYREWVVQ
ncbi:MAG: hypothetical protein Q4B54_04810 [Coriobacteriales bacterium]|nr:hypothetical protein [Coriobacteriales bacterium]